MDDIEYKQWQRAIARESPPVKDEIKEIRDRLGYSDTPPSKDVMPKIELEDHKTPESATFWGKVDDMRFGTIWNQPKVGDKVLVNGRKAVVIEVLASGESVTQVRVAIGKKGDKDVSMLIEPWKLGRDV